MSEFEYQWESGDKAKQKFGGEVFKYVIMDPNSTKGFISVFDVEVACVDALSKDVVILKPRGKKTKAKYAKAKKEWEDAQVIGAGDWVERITRDNSSVKVGDILKCIESAFGSISVDNESPDERHFAKYFRKLTPAEVEAHEASLVPEFEVGDCVYHIDEKNDLTMWRIKSISSHCLSCELEGVDIKGATCSRLLEHLRPATAEEIKAATRTVWSLKDGDEHWHLNHKGEVDLFEWDSNLASCVKGRERGHVFLTRQEAEAEDARRVAANREVSA